jgi:hypothetical protein
MKHGLLIFGLGMATVWIIRWTARVLWPTATPVVRRHWTEEESET